MGISQVEVFKNAAMLLNLLAEASKDESDGGVTVTMGEIVDIFAKVGVSVVGDVTDEDNV